MRASLHFHLRLAMLLACLCPAGCVTEPAPSEPRVYGSITDPKPKKVKASKPKREEEIKVETRPNVQVSPSETVR